MKPNRKILIIDDVKLNLILMRDLLKAHNYEVLAAEDAESGIALAKKNIPKVILMDVKMPGMDGTMAFEILKKDEKTRDIPVIFVTASVNVATNKRIAKTGCLIITKPIDTRTFVARIEEVIGK